MKSTVTSVITSSPRAVTSTGVLGTTAATINGFQLVAVVGGMPTIEVMPPLWCRLDNLWSPHLGIVPGTLTRQPFLCPLDHVFEVNAMMKELPEEEFGPGISFREYSFIDNPLLPKQIKKSWLDVQLCREGSKGCHLTNETSRPRVLRLPKNISEEELKTIMSVFKNVKIIQFSSMQDAFKGFIDEASSSFLGFILAVILLVTLLFSDFL
ncbi:hypothetical protein GIB67_012505 [Kingdonia uniflora]|uniref:Uncharacterized protein n=1 Tax=Kingdonia uniflora TaxID=39325 RepID=A0A7J7MVN2_9MAGN|nr:hypothetical protein GIB67_012505 [Kingdonia uniflora]